MFQSLYNTSTTMTLTRFEGPGPRETIRTVLGFKYDLKWSRIDDFLSCSHNIKLWVYLIPSPLGMGG